MFVLCLYSLSCSFMCHVLSCSSLSSFLYMLSHCSFDVVVSFSLWGHRCVVKMGCRQAHSCEVGEVFDGERSAVSVIVESPLCSENVFSGSSELPSRKGV